MSKTLLAASVVAAILLAGCAASPGADPPGSSSEASSPTQDLPHIDYGVPYRVGHYWVQRSYYADAPDETLQSISYYVQGIEPVGGENALRIESEEAQRIIWVRGTDGAILKESIAGQERTYEPACAAYTADYAEGRTWDHTCYRLGTASANATVADGQSLNTTAKGTEEVTVPAGAFTTTKLETSSAGGLALTEYYAPSACFPARVIVSGGQRVVHLDLITYQC